MKLRNALFSPLAPLALLTLASVGLADVLVVGPPESGALYNQVSEALNSAKDGDQIRILAGSYDGFDVSKGVQIIGEGRELVLITSDNPFVSSMRVLDLEADQALHLSGFSAVSSSGFGSMVVQDCAGVVTMDDLQIGTQEIGAQSVRGLSVRDSSLVLVTNSVIEVPDNPDTGVITFIGAGAAVTVTESTAILEGCEIRGANVNTFGPVVFYTDSFGGAGVEALRSTVVLSDCVVEAGNGGLSDNATITGRGGVAVDIRQGAVFVTGDTILRGGSAPSGTGAVTAAGGSAIQAQGNAKVIVDPSGDLAGGFGFVPAIQAPPIQLLGNALQIPQFTRLLSLHAENLPGQAGYRVDLEARSEPAALVLPFLALGATAPLVVPGLDGLAIIDPSTAIPVAPQTADALGSTVFSLSAAPAPALAGQVLVFHGYWLDATTGAAELGFGSATTLDL